MNVLCSAMKASKALVRADVLKEIDGPMLKHGLQSFQGARIQVPRAEIQKPDRAALEERWGMFRKAV